MARWIVIAVGGAFGAVLLVGAVLFLAGETLFGSSRSAIDDYNQDALRETAVYPGARLIAVRTIERDVDGELVRFLEHVYATAATRDEVLRFYRSNGVSRERGVSYTLIPTWPAGALAGYSAIATPRASRADFLRAHRRPAHR